MYEICNQELSNFGFVWVLVESFNNEASVGTSKEFSDTMQDIESFLYPRGVGQGPVRELYGRISRIVNTSVHECPELDIFTFPV